MPCDVCGEYYFDEESDKHYVSELDIYVCDDCLARIEEHHGVDGKYVVEKCKECGHVKGVTWHPYKKRGRPAGSKNEKKEAPEKTKTLEAFV